eukprot:scaffold56902_cov19-Tisochrysis_lutea.AAC.1
MAANGLLPPGALCLHLVHFRVCTWFTTVSALGSLLCLHLIYSGLHRLFYSSNPILAWMLECGCDADE